MKYLLLALAGPCHLREQALERGVLVQLVLLHQPAQVARGGRQLDLRGEEDEKDDKEQDEDAEEEDQLVIPYGK